MKLMQLPDLYIRGSIGTQTMSNLTQEQIAETDGIVRRIRDEPDLAGSKFEFCKQLGATIRADYYSDRDVAEQEFTIAIWRATIHLLYHKSYSYRCKLCNCDEYTTKNGRTKVFDRQYKICPSCNSGYINTDGNNEPVILARHGKQYCLLSKDNTVIESDRHKSTLEDIVSSPIDTIYGDTKIDNPYEVINDPIQRNKWYTIWIWNYFRQILNENIIKTNKQKVTASGPANYIAFQLLLHELQSRRIKHYYDPSTLRQTSSDLEVSFAIYATNPDFTTQVLIPLSIQYASEGVDLIISATSIKILAQKDAQMVSASFVTSSPVIMLSTESSSKSNNDTDNPDGSWRDIIEHNSRHDSYDNHIYDIEVKDLFTNIRQKLNNTLEQEVFDVYSQTGNTWDRFSNIWGQRQACKTHIAKFFNISSKKVDEIKQNIAEQCEAYGLA